ncbi:MAG: tol-pal system YbgF family protein [Sandaracinaceae bacterium]
MGRRPSTTAEPPSPGPRPEGSAAGGARADVSGPPRRAEAEPAQPDLDPVDRRERELFEAAHRAHFGPEGQAAALAAWNRYLAAYPRGRYVPEARYNRALTLIRLGRYEEARRALAPYAAGAYDGVRQEDAAALLDALRGR